MKTSKNLFDRRKKRNRFSLRRAAKGKPRLSVFRSGKHIYVQVIDDGQGRTLAAASTVDKDVRAKLKSCATTEAATAVGSVIAERAKKAGVEDVVFDRGGYNYHGRIRALAEAAREGGLRF